MPTCNCDTISRSPTRQSSLRSKRNLRGLKRLETVPFLTASNGKQIYLTCSFAREEPGNNKEARAQSKMGSPSPSFLLFFFYFFQFYAPSYFCFGDRTVRFSPIELVFFCSSVYDSWTFMFIFVTYHEEKCSPPSTSGVTRKCRDKRARSVLSALRLLGLALKDH